MKCVNLIPQYRRHAMRVRERRSRWITICAGYALFLVVSIVVSSLVRVSDDRALQGQITRTNDVIETGRLSLGDLRSALEHSTSILRANRAVGSQPDWGVLLALVGEATRGEILLRVCRLEPTSRASLGPGGGLTAPVAGSDERERPNAITLELGGVGQTQQAVAQFVLRMEQMPLFEHVKLIDTKLEPFLSGEAVAFRLQCQLDPGKGDQP